MAPKTKDKTLDQSLIKCDEEINIQNVLMEQFLNAALEVSNNESAIAEREFEYKQSLHDYTKILKQLQSELEVQKEIKAEIAEIKKELEDSPYIEEMKAHAILQTIINEKSRQLTNKFNKKLSKEQVVNYKERRARLELERKNNFRMQKLNEELESVQLEHRELVAIKEQKMKRHDNLKKTYDDVMSRRSTLIAKREELEKELEELERESTTSIDESSDDDFDII